MTHNKLNKLAAIHVMKWSEYPQEEARDCPLFVNENFKEVWSWNPCESIADAWLLVEKMKEKDLFITIHGGFAGQEKIEVFEGDSLSSRCECVDSTAPLAITKACLKAMGKGR